MSGILCRMARWPHRRTAVPLLALFFALFMTAAGSAGAIEAAGSAVAPHHGAAAADLPGQPHHGTAAAAESGCGAGHAKSGDAHDGPSSTCCGFACHVTLAADFRPLMSPPGRGEPAGRIADSIRIAGSDPFERPPRAAASSHG